MNKPTFIISFDCEGKWGMIDHLSEQNSNLLTNERLNDVYSNITDIMNIFNIKGTFAFVGAFTMTKEEFINLNHFFNNKSWLKRLLKDVENNKFDGWLNPKALDIVRSKKIHEIASHSFSHLPLSESLIDKKMFIDEMKKMQIIMNLKDIDISTFIYPRNIAGFISELNQFGIKGYRQNYFGNDSYLLGKAKSFLSELNITQKAQEHSLYQEPIKIPSGYFLNWRSKLRKSIPISVSIKRWERAINDAIVNNRVIHLWTHPHNFITGNKQYKLFENILKIVSEARDERKINILTQNEYCRMIASERL